MFLTNILLKKPKSKDILVLLQSVITGHKIMRVRPRLAEKLEFIWFDPYIQQKSLYKEKKKLRNL